MKCTLLQILLKEWSIRAYFWTEIMAEPSSTLEATRTLVSVTRLCVVLRVSALFMQMIVIFRPFQSIRPFPFFSRDYLLLFLEKPWGRVPFCCGLWRESYLQRLLCLHQSLWRIRGVLHSRQQPQMEGQHQHSKFVNELFFVLNSILLVTFPIHREYILVLDTKIFGIIIVQLPWMCNKNVDH